MANQEKGHQIIWAAFKAGEKEAFSQLFFSYYDPLYRYGLKMIGDEEFVKDIIQDFFIYLFEKRASLPDHIDRPTSYLLTSFRRKLLYEKNNRKGKYEIVEASDQTMAQLFVIGKEDIIIKEESDLLNKTMIVKLLNELPPRQREIIYLKYYYDLGTQEIADMLSISYQVVANHLYRALKKLRNHDASKKFAQSNTWILFNLLL